MIGYRISLKDLEQLIEHESPGWLAKSRARVEGFRRAGEYKEKSSIWKRVKPVYMRLQGGSKCAFCERKLESEVYGKGEQAVEHFRPKKRIQKWTISKRLEKLGVQCADVPNEGGGYYLLPYHPFNYSASCIPCNSALKKDYFPIAASYDLRGDDPTVLLEEEPFLIYPIGDFDEQPEKLIHFYGYSPQAVPHGGHARLRALVTIEFFKLDHRNRKNLFRERAAIIVALYPQLKVVHGHGSVKAQAEARALINGFTRTNAPHTNCAKSFQALFPERADEAKVLFDKASDYISSIS